MRSFPAQHHAASSPVETYCARLEDDDAAQPGPLARDRPLGNAGLANTPNYRRRLNERLGDRIATWTRTG